MTYRLLSLIVAYLLWVGCSGNLPDKELTHALEYAGENRAELERVLTHYAAPEDSLKLKAARFLIANMPGHYSYKGTAVDRYYKEIDPILKDDSLSIPEVQVRLGAVASRYPNLGRDLIEDIKIIKGDFLIKNIEDAFALWEKPWTSHLSFEEFCEAILPYKCVELQSLDSWRDTLSNKFSSKFDTWYRGVLLYSSFELYNSLMEDVLAKKPQVHIALNNYYKPLAASNISDLRMGDCEDYMNVVVPIFEE